MHELRVAAWSILPFSLLLLAIALLPLIAHKWWHANGHKAIVSLGLAGPVLAYLCWLEWGEGQPALLRLEHAGLEYIDFIVLLATLYTVAGGIAVQGQFRPTPLINVGILAFGAVLANVIGTTGASMLLIRPMLRINHVRHHRGHLPVFFIILVSNLGGLLTPLGDPPLFLGFLNGVPFFWTFTMWPIWLLVNGVVLAIALGWDAIAYWREPDRQAFPPRHGSFVIAGSINIVLLIGVLAAVLARSSALMGDYHIEPRWSVAILSCLALLSWLCTARSVREHNHFSWGPIVEIAVLFVGIFATMIPALALLTHHRDELGILAPGQYFWLTGLLSACLDNAPTYVTFAALASGGQNLADLARDQPLLLQAISAGAVFMGALTYIGNGPNFMVKSIAEQMDYPMPTFFGYILYSTLILLPVFALATYIFFPF